MRAAAECRGRVEVLAGLGEKTRVFANANGSFTAETAAIVQRVRAAGGKWVKPDPTLRRGADGRIVPAATALDISFSGGGAGAAATIGKGSARLGLTWPSALPAPVLSGANATYPEVLPGVDLVLTAQAEGFAEMLVVKNAAAAANPRLVAVRFGTTVNGLRLRQDAGGSLTATDDAGATMFGSGNPVMWDSSTAGESRRLVVPGAKRRAMPLQLTGNALVVHPDLAMLRDKATRFPVYIDPALGKTAWTMINSHFPDQSYWSFDKQDCPAPYASIQCAKVGYTNDPTAMIYRSMFAFGISGLMRKHIQDAKLSMDTVYSWTNTDYGTQVRVTGAITSNTKWSNNSSTWGAVAATANSHAHDRVRRRTEWGVTSALQTAVGGTNTTWTLGLRAVSESDVNQWKKFDAGTALLTVVYNSFPNSPDTITVGGQPCARGSARPYVRTTTPVLKARLSDPDGTGRLLKGTFYWWNFSGGVVRTAANSVFQGSVVSGQTATATVPAGKLADGGVYVVQVIANDGVDNGQYSATCEFQIDTTGPGTPSAVTSTEYPNDGQIHGGVGTEGAFVLKPPTVIPPDFWGYAYTLDAGVSAAAATQVAANSTDRTATVAITPTIDQTYNLRVWATDQAGNPSTTPLTYTFSVRAGTGPDARWTFDGENGDDASLHGNTATFTGSTWTPGRGSFGKAVVLNGTSQAATTSQTIATREPATNAWISVHTNMSFTVAATVRLDSAAGTGQRVVLAQDSSRTSPFVLSYATTEKKWRFAIAQTDVDAPATAAVLSDATATVGAWTRLLATYDGTSHVLRLYVNGVLQTATATSVTFDAIGPATIGRMMSAGAPAGYFPGAIDDIRVYGRSVGAAEHEFAVVNYPNPPIVSFPAGTSAYAGRPVQAVISAGGDPAVTKVRYQLGASGTATTVTLPAAGGQTTVNVTRIAVGDSLLMASGIDAAGGLSPIASALLTFTEAPALTGRVTDGTSGAALSGITVVLSPGDLTRTTDTTGTYTFTGMNAGAYTVTATNGGSGCAGQIATTEVDIDHGVTVDLNLAPESDRFGYTCRTNTNTAFVPGPVKANLTFSNDVTAELPLPFPVPYYGQTYGTYRISANGFLAFGSPSGNYPGWPTSLPDRRDAPRAAAMPFLTDLTALSADSLASIWTGTVGSGAEQRFVIEWRNMRLDRAAGERVSFEALVAPNGDITFNYSGLSDDASRGADAAVGITSPGGNYALQYSFQDAALASNRAVTFAYPADPWPIPYGTLSGTVTHGGLPAPGVKVKLEDRTTISDGSGHYQFDDVESGFYEVDVHTGCDGKRQSNLWVENNTVVDLPMGNFVDAYGYYCDLEDVDWIPGTTLLPDGYGEDMDLPFPFPFYGKTYQTADLSPGWFYVRDPGGTGGGDIEFVDRIETTEDYSVYVRTVGSAPHRQFVIEARDLTPVDHPDIRYSSELIIGEDGTLKVVSTAPPELYDPTAAFPLAIWFYSLDYGEIDYFEDGRGYPLGKSVVIHPPTVS